MVFHKIVKMENLKVWEEVFLERCRFFFLEKIIIVNTNLTTIKITNMRTLFFFVFIFFCIHSQGQQSPWEIQIGISSNVTWVNGKNDLDISFTKEIQIPSPNFGVQYAISESISLEFDYRLERLTSNYSIPSVNLIGEMVELDYQIRSVSNTIQLNSNFLIFPRKSTLLTTGVSFSFAEINKWKLLNLSEFSIPVFAPFFAQIELADWNYGLNFEIKQPLYSWELSKIYLAGYYVLGLKNVNMDSDNSLKTRMVGVKIFWGVNLKRRK